MEASLPKVPLPFSVIFRGLFQCVRAPTSLLSWFILIRFYTWLNLVVSQPHDYLSSLHTTWLYFHMFPVISFYCDESLLSAIILCFCWALVRRESYIQGVVVLYCSKAGAYKDSSQQIRTFAVCIPGQRMEPPGRDWLLIIALDVGCMWREDEIIGGADIRGDCQRPIPDTHTQNTHFQSRSPVQPHEHAMWSAPALCIVVINIRCSATDSWDITKCSIP